MIQTQPSFQERLAGCKALMSNSIAIPDECDREMRVEPDVPLLALAAVMGPIPPTSTAL